MDNWPTHHIVKESEEHLGAVAAADLGVYVSNLRRRNLAPIISLGHLAKITGVSYTFLRLTVQRRRDFANYKIFSIGKRNGKLRYIHSPCKNLLLVQKFLNEEVLQKRKPHEASYAFHQSGGIRACAEVHCGATWLLSFDIKNFFYNINEIDVYDEFLNLGYTKLLSFELARICTTTFAPAWWNPESSFINKYILGDPDRYKFYKSLCSLGCLPQGAPSSPMLSNLVATRLDHNLSYFAKKNGLIYSRYADDISFSCGGRLKRKNNPGRHVAKIYDEILGCGFTPNKSKTRIAGPGSQKKILGLLIDGPKPRLSKPIRKRIERHLYISNKFGIEKASEHEGFRSPFGYYNHLAGLLAYVKDVDFDFWIKYKKLYRNIDSPILNEKIG